MSERTINFDTHRFVKRLVETGMSEPTAEVLADEQARLLTDNLANKTDLLAVKADLQRDTSELRRDMATTEARLMRWMAGLLIAQGGVIVGLMQVLG